MIDEMTKTYSRNCNVCGSPMLYVIKTDTNEMLFYGQGVVDCKVCGRKADTIKSDSVELDKLFIILKLHRLYSGPPDSRIQLQATCVDCGRTESFPANQFSQPGIILEANHWTVTMSVNETPQHDLARCPDCSLKELTRAGTTVKILKKRQTSNRRIKMETEFNWGKLTVETDTEYKQAALADLWKKHINSAIKDLIIPRRENENK